jgi:hypothetical protein
LASDGEEQEGYQNKPLVLSPFFKKITFIRKGAGQQKQQEADHAVPGRHDGEGIDQTKGPVNKIIRWVEDKEVEKNQNSQDIQDHQRKRQGERLFFRMIGLGMEISRLKIFRLYMYRENNVKNQIQKHKNKTDS